LLKSYVDGRHRCCEVIADMRPSFTLAPADLAIEAVYGEILGALENGWVDRLQPLWAEFERDLFRHFEEEERTILADFLAARPREARLILEEHRYLRDRLMQLRERLPNVSLVTARTFLDELRAHAQHEERVLRRWTDSSAPVR
jgi:hypothetical protein